MKGWLGIAAFVAVYDGWAAVMGHPTLSRSFSEGSKEHPYVITAITTYLVVHLYGKWPPRYDPLHGYCVAGQLLLEKVNRG